MKREATVARALNGFPHSRQNFAPAGSSVPHIAHLRARAVPHSRQNFAWGGFSWWQRGHLIMQPSSKRLDRSDILIQMEQVGRIILRFQGSQALVVRPVGCRDGVFALILS